MVFTEEERLILLYLSQYGMCTYTELTSHGLAKGNMALEVGEGTNKFICGAVTQEAYNALRRLISAGLIDFRCDVGSFDDIVVREGVDAEFLRGPALKVNHVYVKPTGVTAFFSLSDAGLATVRQEQASA